MTVIENRTFDEERALYGSRNVTGRNLRFDGPADGESAFKESSDIVVESCYFNLRYPFWHDHNLVINNCEMTEICRASIWYSDNISIKNTKMHGIKALRECKDVSIEGCDIISPEFGWSVDSINMKDSSAQSEYFMMRCSDINFTNVNLKGKYSFQYIKNAVFEDCNFDTKDSFWHGENIIVRNSTIKGEYLAWYSKNLTLENCHIIGTQPFCYCDNLKLINCTMEACDLAFEKSEVNATITSHVDSIKNPKSGKITVASVGEIIRDDAESRAEIVFA